MNTVTLITIEGHEVSLSSDDHAKLVGWPGIDLSRVHTIGDDAYAEVRGKPHHLSLEDMLALMAPPVPVAALSAVLAPSQPTPASACKVCVRCGESKAAGMFAHLFGDPEGKKDHCKPCRNRVHNERAKAQRTAQRAGGRTHKICATCKAEKPLSEYKPAPTSDGYMHNCKPCRTEGLKALAEFKRMGQALADKPKTAPRPGGRLDHFLRTGSTAYLQGERNTMGAHAAMSVEGKYMGAVLPPNGSGVASFQASP